MTTMKFTIYSNSDSESDIIYFSPYNLLTIAEIDHWLNEVAPKNCFIHSGWILPKELTTMFILKFSNQNTEVVYAG